MMKTLTDLIRYSVMTTLCLTACLGTAAAQQVDVNLGLALRTQPNEQRGARIYARHCVQCHQLGAVGSPDNIVPALAGQHYAYLVKQAVDFLDTARASATMHTQLSKGGVADTHRIADVMAYVANLPEAVKVEAGPNAEPALGEQTYQRDCQSCHGQQAQGNADLWVPSLRGQHYRYLLGQMRVFGERANVSEDVHILLKDYSDTQRQAVADWLSNGMPAADMPIKN